LLEKEEFLKLLSEAEARLESRFSALPDFDSGLPGAARAGGVLNEVADRLADNYPYFHPLYAGQMLKPPHPMARAAYALTMGINPNNHALDGGRASSAMEKEAVAQIAFMFGWETHLGHLTQGGTMANLEALWVATNLRPFTILAASAQAHYTHGRMSEVLRMPFEALATDNRGRIDPRALEARLSKSNDIGCVIVTLGTTATGSVDPLPEIVSLRSRFGFRLHVDAAYGGYFKLAGNLDDEVRSAFACIRQADSIVIDPHKHGLQPYGCGCVVFRDPSVGQIYSHESPYTYFSSKALHLGEISLECSRPGAAAVALWATQRLLPLVPGGEFAMGLESCHRAAQAFADRLTRDGRFLVPFPPQLDIVVWAPRAKNATEASALSQRIFDEAAKMNLHLALARLPVRFFEAACPELEPGEKEVLCLRSVLMKPEHESWLEEIVRILGVATDRALAAEK
jgi:glutamate/tyrosine decarboxylase-like PLP-dependent enzyme